MGVLRLRHTMRRTCMLGALLVCGVSNAQSQRADLVTVYVNAIENNAAYRSAVMQYNAALEARPAARGKLLPQLGVQADYDWVRQEVDGTYYGFPAINRSDDFERYLYGAALSQTIFRMDQFIDLKKAESQIGQARLALATAKDELQIGVAKAYFALLGAQETLISVRAEKEAVGRQLDQMQGRFDSGLVADADLKAAQSRQDLVLAEEISAENEVEIARTQIELVSGRLFADVETLPADVPLPALEYDRVENWIDRAMQHNLPLTKVNPFRIASGARRIKRSCPNILIKVFRRRLTISRKEHLLVFDIDHVFPSRINIISNVCQTYPFFNSRCFVF